MQAMHGHLKPEFEAPLKIRFKLFVLPRTIFLLIFLLASFPSKSELQTVSKLSGTLRLTTEYFWHGYTKSDGDPVVQANLDYEHWSGIYFGAWVSMVDFGDSEFDDQSRVEIFPYLGTSFELSEDWRANVAWSRYLYDGKSFGQIVDYNLFYATLTFRDLVSAQVGFSESGYNAGGFFGYYQVTGKYPLMDVLDTSITVGYSQSSEVLNFDYFYWDVGLTWYYKFLGFDFRYVDSNRLNRNLRTMAGPEAVDPTFLFSLSVGF